MIRSSFYLFILIGSFSACTIVLFNFKASLAVINDGLGFSKDAIKDSKGAHSNLGF